MEIIFYSKSENIRQRKLISIITKLVPNEKISICQDQDAFAQKLAEGKETRFLLVVLADSIEDIVDIYFLQTLLVRHRVLLCMPDYERDSAALANRLKARVIGCMEDNSFDMTTFLEELSVHKQLHTNFVTTLKDGTTSQLNEPAPIAA